MIKAPCEQWYGESGLPKGNVSTLLAEMSQVARESALVRAHFQHVHSLRGEISEAPDTRTKTKQP